MANGSITIEQAQEILRGKPADEQLAFIYAAIINQSHVCMGRPLECNRRYLSKRWLKERKLVIAGFVVGWFVANGVCTWGALKIIGWI